MYLDREQLDLAYNKMMKAGDSSELSSSFKTMLATMAESITATGGTATAESTDIRWLCEVVAAGEW